MNCWDILQLDPGSDVRAIKRGYAKKLKTTKPDEDPEGFKILNSAYKQALKIARRNGTKSSNVEIQPTEITHSNEKVEPLSGSSFASDDSVVEGIQYELPAQEEELCTEELKSDLAEGAEIDDVEKVSEPSFHSDENVAAEEYPLENIDQVDGHCTEEVEPDLVESVQILLSDKSRLNNVSEWELLLESPALYEISYRSWFTLKLFQMVCNHQWAVASKEYAVNTKLSRTVLHFLNDTFLWSSQTERLEEHFDYKEIEHFKYWLLSPADKFLTKYTCDKQHQGEIENGTFWCRIFAYFIDAVIFFGVSYLFVQLNDMLPPSLTISLTTEFVLLLVWLILLFPLMEASSFQGTPGKMCLGLKVVNVEGHRLSIIHALGRQMAFLLTMAFCKITIWINIVGFLGERLLVQDRVSLSRVIKRD